MTYATFIYKAKELTIQQLDNGTWYLEPEWQDMLYREGLGELDDLEDSYLSGWYDVEDILKLEVERRNARDNKKNEVINWLHEVITATVEPAMTQEETDYIAAITEFIKANHREASFSVAGDREASLGTAGDREASFSTASIREADVAAQPAE